MKTKCLEHKTVILGVSASIAAYKACDIASSLAKDGCDTHVILTPNTTKLIAPICFSTLTSNNCLTDTFDTSVNYNVAHVSLAKRADLLVIAPATANIIAKLANGIADDMLTTTALACRCPKLIAPAMNTAMYENPVTQKNLKTLKDLGWMIIEPDTGVLACKDEGKGKFPAPQVIIDRIHLLIEKVKDLEGLKVVITAGPTQEAIDPVRFISNHSSGKMGYALAKEAVLRGADVTLISGPVSLKPYDGIRLVPVTTAEEMYKAVENEQENFDILIKAAAVADYTPKTVRESKIKKTDKASLDSGIELKRTKDILAEIGNKKKDGQFVCGFAMETEDLLAHAREKLKKKNADMICANSLRTEGAGFQGDTNVITILTEDETKACPLNTKESLSGIIFDEILKNRKKTC